MIKAVSQIILSFVEPKSHRMTKGPNSPHTYLLISDKNAHPQPVPCISCAESGHTRAFQTKVLIKFLLSAFYTELDQDWVNVGGRGARPNKLVIGQSVPGSQAKELLGRLRFM